MLSDKNLIKRLKMGDEAAFNELYHAYIGLVKHVVLNMIHDASEVEDICQITFWKLMENLDNYKGGSLKYYLLQIAKNEAKQYIRRQNNEKKYLDESAYLTKNVLPFQDRVWEHIVKILSKEEYYIFVLHFVYNFNFKEIALEIDKSKTACYNLYKDALTKVKKYLKGDEKNEIEGFKK